MIIHQANVDKNGNYRDRSRKDDGYIRKFDDSNPFPALVTAWYPSSQTIDVSAWTPWGQKEIEGVVVYGDFMQSVGTIKTPKIATAKGLDTENSWQTYRNPNQANPSSDEYVLDNHIEALVTKTSVGYATLSFRFATPDSPLLNNAKYGRTLKRYDDGSYKIHDDDGNMQFKHPSGLNIRIGNSTSDIDLEVPFPDHAKNVQDYAGEIIAKFEHPAGSTIDYDNDGLLGITSGTSENLKVVIDSFIDEVIKIIVNDGVGPDVSALNVLKADLAKLLK